MQVLTMNDYILTRILMGILVRQCANVELEPPGRQSRAATSAEADPKEEGDTCGGFLCAGNSCRRTLRITPVMGLHALVFILTNTKCDPAKILVPMLNNDPKWSSYLDRTQVNCWVTYIAVDSFIFVMILTYDKIMVSLRWSLFNFYSEKC